jgi:predicted transcriptional regulator
VGEVSERCDDKNTIGPDTDAVDAISRMHKNLAGRMIVVEGGELIGIIALKDLLNFLSMKIELEEVA